jgi:hypothetical protein
MTTVAAVQEPPITRQRHPLLAASAVTSFVVTIAVLVVPHDFLPESPAPEEVTAFFEQNYLVQQSQTLMHSLGAIALLVFFAQLAGVVRRLEREHEPWSWLTLAAAAAFTAVVVVTMGWVSAVVILTGDLDGGLQETMYMMGWDFHFRVLYLVPLLTLPACHVLRRSGAAPRLVTWSGTAVGAAALVSTLGYLGRETWVVQYPMFMLFLLWTLVTGLVLGLRGVGPYRS